MKNKYKTAGKWNILCGVLYGLTFVSYALLFFIAYIADSLVESWGEGLLDSLIDLAPFGLIIVASLLSSILMIFTGKTMRQGNTEKGSVKVTFAVNELLKLASLWILSGFCFLNLVLVGFSEEWERTIFGAYVVLGTILKLLIVISIVMDLVAFFQRKSKKKKK